MRGPIKQNDTRVGPGPKRVLDYGCKEGALSFQKLKTFMPSCQYDFSL